MRFEMDDIVAIVKPHNDRIVAQHRADEADQKLAELYVRLFDLRASLGACVALMEFDIAERGIPLTDTRRDVIARAKAAMEKAGIP
jgi:hypothetical protein